MIAGMRDIWRWINDSNSMGAAVLKAFFGAERSFSYYPNFIDQMGNRVQIDTEDAIKRILDEIAKYDCPTEKEVHFLIERGRETLDEVKGLTEYEDQKATRNLTVVTFLSALTGVLFSNFSEKYPFNPQEEYSFSIFEFSIFYSNYILFSSFILCAICGALVVFHATRIRFKYPELKPSTTVTKTQRTKSFLFYPEILSVDPESWAASFFGNFRENSTKSRSGITDLGFDYVKNYVVESYLVAAKVADKLRILKSGQDLLNLSIKILFLWAVVFIIGMLALPATSLASSDILNVEEIDIETGRKAGGNIGSGNELIKRNILHKECLYRQRMGLGQTSIPIP